MLPPEKRRQTSFNNKQQLHEKKSIAVKVRNKTKNHNLLECGHCKGFYAKDYFLKKWRDEDELGKYLTACLVRQKLCKTSNESELLQSVFETRRCNVNCTHSEVKTESRKHGIKNFRFKLSAGLLLYYADAFSKTFISHCYRILSLYRPALRVDINE